MSSEDLPATAIFDLMPSPLVPPYQPFRDGIKNPQPRPSWSPPPLPDGYVRVELDEDYYTGATFGEWTELGARYPARVFDVPREQYERWIAARDAYAAVQEEIEAMREERQRTPGFAPDGWVRTEQP